MFLGDILPAFRRFKIYIIILFLGVTAFYLVASLVDCRLAGCSGSSLWTFSPRWRRCFVWNMIAFFSFACRHFAGWLGQCLLFLSSTFGWWCSLFIGAASGCCSVAGFVLFRSNLGFLGDGLIWFVLLNVLVLFSAPTLLCDWFCRSRTLIFIFILQLCVSKE